VRRLHLRPERPAPVAQDAAPPVDELRGERRVRESGGPIDRAQYACSCGYVFDAAVSTSVACPHCGTPQAW
jgi:rubrerythrin